MFSYTSENMGESCMAAISVHTVFHNHCLKHILFQFQLCGNTIPDLSHFIQDKLENHIY